MEQLFLSMFCVWGVKYRPMVGDRKSGSKLGGKEGLLSYLYLAEE